MEPTYIEAKSTLVRGVGVAETSLSGNIRERRLRVIGSFAISTKKR